MTTAPKRKIVDAKPSLTNSPSRRMKKPMYIRLECGHHDIVGKTEVNQGWVYCWDCHYNKPKAFDMCIEKASMTAW